MVQLLEERMATITLIRWEINADERGSVITSMAFIVLHRRPHWRRNSVHAAADQVSPANGTL